MALGQVARQIERTERAMAELEQYDAKYAGRETSGGTGSGSAEASYRQGRAPLELSAAWAKQSLSEILRAQAELGEGPPVEMGRWERAD